MEIKEGPIKKKDLMVYLVMGALILSIIIAVFLRFIFQGKDGSKILEKTAGIRITDMMGKQVRIDDLLKSKVNVYILIMEPGNCPPCIHKGITDLSNLQKAGNHCLAIVVHQWPEEVKGWSRNYGFSPFYVIPPTIFSESFNITYLPALLKIRDHKVKNIRHITY